MGTLIIGKNPAWKQEINLGRRTNQNFVQVPHARFIHMLTYKAELVGIQVVLLEESHTSKCSFLDHEPVQHHERYVGRRAHRGLFRASGSISNNTIAVITPDGQEITLLPALTRGNKAQGV